jgi:hypothetical protein
MFNPINVWFNGHLKYTWVKDCGVGWSWVVWTQKNTIWIVDMHTSDSWSWKLKVSHQMIKGYSFGKGIVQSVKKHIWYTFVEVSAKLVEFKCTLNGSQIEQYWVNGCISSNGSKFWKALWYLLRVWDLE